MPKVAVYNMQGAKVDEIELSPEVFGVEMNEHVVHSVVVAQLANRRQGTQSALTRSEVRGGGIKPWRQKGTGRARHGSIRSPQWRHGGVVFAPKPRSYRQQTNKKVKRLAMRCALSNLLVEDALIVVDSMELEAPKTKLMATALEAMGADKKVLLVVPTDGETVKRAARNLPIVKMVDVGTLNTYDIMNCTKMVITKSDVQRVEEVFGQ